MLRSGFLTHSARHAAFSRWLVARHEITVYRLPDDSRPPFIPPMRSSQGIADILHAIQGEDFIAATNSDAIIDEGDSPRALVDANPAGDAIILDDFPLLSSALDTENLTARATDAPAMAAPATIPDRRDFPADTAIASQMRRASTEPALVRPESAPRPNADQADEPQRATPHDWPARTLDSPMEPAADAETSAPRAPGAAEPVDVAAVPPALGRRRAAPQEPAGAEAAMPLEPPDIPTRDAGLRPEPSIAPLAAIPSSAANEQIAVAQPQATASVPDVEPLHGRGADMREVHADAETLTPPQAGRETMQPNRESAHQRVPASVASAPARTRWQGARNFVQARLDGRLHRRQTATSTSATASAPLHDDAAPPINLLAVQEGMPTSAAEAPPTNVTASGQFSPPALPPDGAMVADAATLSVAQRQAAADAPQRSAAIEHDMPVAQNEVVTPMSRQEPRNAGAGLPAPHDLSGQRVPAISAAYETAQSPNADVPARPPYEGVAGYPNGEFAASPVRAHGMEYPMGQAEKGVESALPAVGTAADESPERRPPMRESAERLSDAAEHARPGSYTPPDTVAVQGELASTSAARSAAVPEYMESPGRPATDPPVNDTDSAKTLPVSQAGTPATTEGTRAQFEGEPPNTSIHAEPPQQQPVPADTRRIASPLAASDRTLAPMPTAGEPGITPPHLPASPQQVEPLLQQGIEVSSDTAPTAAQQPARPQARDDRSLPHTAITQPMRAEQSDPVSETHSAASMLAQRTESSPDAARPAAQRAVLAQVLDDGTPPQATVPQPTQTEQSAPVSEMKTVAGPLPQQFDIPTDHRPARPETPALAAQPDAPPSAPPEIRASQAVIAQQRGQAPGRFDQPTMGQATTLPQMAPSQPVARPRFVAPLPRAARTLAAWLKPKPTLAQSEIPTTEGSRGPLSIESRDPLPVESNTVVAGFAGQADAAQQGDDARSVASDHAAENSLPTFEGVSIPPTALTSDAVERPSAAVAPPPSDAVRPFPRPGEQIAAPVAASDTTATLATSIPNEAPPDAAQPAPFEPQLQIPGNANTNDAAFASPIAVAPAMEPRTTESEPAPTRLSSSVAVTPAMQPQAIPPMLQSDRDDVYRETKELNDSISHTAPALPRDGRARDDQTIGADVTSPPVALPSNQPPQDEAIALPPNINSNKGQPLPRVQPAVVDALTPTAIARAASVDVGGDERPPEIELYAGNSTDAPSVAFGQPESPSSPVGDVAKPQSLEGAGTSRDIVVETPQTRADTGGQPALDLPITPPSIAPTAVRPLRVSQAEPSQEMASDTTPLSHAHTSTAPYGDSVEADDGSAVQRDTDLRRAIARPPSAPPESFLNQRAASANAEHEQSDENVGQSDVGPISQIALDVTAPVIESQPASFLDNPSEKIAPASEAEALSLRPRTQEATAPPLDGYIASRATPQREISAQAPSIQPQDAIPLSPQPSVPGEPRLSSPAAPETTTAAPATPIGRRAAFASATAATPPSAPLPVEAAPSSAVLPGSIPERQPTDAADAPPVTTETRFADAPASVKPGLRPTEQMMLPAEDEARTVIDRAIIAMPTMVSRDAASQSIAQSQPAMPPLTQQPTQDAVTASVDEAPRAVANASTASERIAPGVSPVAEVTSTQPMPASVPATAVRDENVSNAPLPPSDYSQPEGAVATGPIAQVPVAQQASEYSQPGAAIPTATTTSSSDQTVADAPVEPSPTVVNEVRQARRRPIIRARPPEEPPRVLTAEEEAAEAAERAKRVRDLARLRHMYYGTPLDDPATTPLATVTESPAATLAPKAMATPPGMLPTAPPPLDRASDATALEDAPVHGLPSVAEAPAPLIAPPAPARPVPVPEAVPTPIALPDATRRFLRPLVGFDPQTVPIYRDAATDRLTTGQNADALTDGRAVVVASTNLATGRPETLGLLAHELTHVARQQRPRFVPPIARSETRASREPVAAAESSSARAASLTEESLAERVEERVTRAARLATAPSPPVSAVSPSPVNRERTRDEAPRRPQPSPTFSSNASWDGLPAPWEAVPDWMREPPASPALSTGDASPEASSLGTRTPVVQRAGNERSLGGQQHDESPQHGPQDGHDGSSEPDLDVLARQVYAILKNRLSVERRRIG